ncbi:hypothetical protein [Runella sp.]|uniref:hypothetical protein n=1 Tax=Runella sp. TaxID=1960881 RepID=UPI003D0D0DC5
MKLLLTAFLIGLSLSIQAQCRPATAAENQAYERVVKELQRQFTTITPEGNWKVFDEKHSMGNLEVTSEWGGFVHLCTDRYDLTMESTELMAARKAELDTMKPDSITPPSLYVHRDTMYQENPKAIAQRAKDTYSVSVEMNLGNYRLQDIESARIVENVQNISVPGSPIALEVRLKPDLKGAIGRQETVILLGGWNTTPIKKGQDTRYQPKFKKGGKLVENIVVTITAPAEMARQLVAKIDWKAIDAVLLK